MQIVRQSKYRHIFGTAFKNELTYQDLKFASTAWDPCDFIRANATFFAIPWQSGGGGSMAVIKHSDTGKARPDTPVLTGHRAQILDFDFNPFNDFILATGSEDCTVKVWGIPQEGLTQTIDTPLVSLDAHGRRVGIVRFHPTASNVLTTVGLDHKLKLWDIEEVACKSVVEGFGDTVQSLDYNLDGSLMVVTSKDKTVRIVDPRDKNFVSEAPGHQGFKGSRVVWMKRKDIIVTFGFSRTSERQYFVWDPKQMEKPLETMDIDQSSGVLMPFYDEDTGVLYVAGKGDGNIRFYEYTEKMYFLNEFKTSSPQRGMTMMPKLALDTQICETTRFLKLENHSVTPIMFQVPRKSEIFQEDIYPDTFAPEPTATSEEYFSGVAHPPKDISMRPEDRKETTTAPKMSDFKPKVEYKEPEKLPPKSTDPKTLMAQNDELRSRIQNLEMENETLRKKLADAGLD